ncbi:hypothetical protein PDE_00605 [Penicillium oxalicum 114-2]|uniref:Uncharacterized protein n=1 Tax=Penicillium oxalicum (strain 114-2 / CGMCC 5302) TaxID=933388 RepID=S7ZAF7_PENO1|nr:hypothetical protein PDE_00605 [Penicillium oxalicum 114-2]
MASLPPAHERQYYTKRENWASHEPGVILVFCIVFIVVLGIAALFVSQALSGYGFCTDRVFKSRVEILHAGKQMDDAGLWENRC